jgi:BrnA antitoxin of type II toxin-antitoxin system
LNGGRPVRRGTRITILIDDDVLPAFRARAEREGKSYQTLINAALRAAITPGDPRQVRLDCQSGAVRIEIAAGSSPPFSPEPPALAGVGPPFLTQRVDVPEVPRGTPLDERHHFARDQVWLKGSGRAWHRRT